MTGYDLVVANARLITRERPVQIAVQEGRIAALLNAEEQAPSQRTVDAAGDYVGAPFVDAHFHLDSVLTRIPNRTGTLREGIDNWNRYKQTELTVEDVYRRADRYCERAFRQGIQAIRSHVDICDPALRGVEALVQLRKDWMRRIDIQLVAFPQDGLFDTPQTEAQLLRALDLGVDVVGGIPHNERSVESGWRSIARLMEIATSRGLSVDMHCDESDDPLSRHIEVLTEQTQRLGMAGRVTASHITSTAMMDPYYLHRKLIPQMQRAGIHIVVNPLINVHLGGRFHHPAPRAMAPIGELMEAGLLVACAQDCNEDPWYPLGDANMFEVAKMAAHIAHLMGAEALGQIVETVSSTPARIMGLEGYGLAPGDRANMIVFDAPSAIEALRIDARRRIIIRGGVVEIEHDYAD